MRWREIDEYDGVTGHMVFDPEPEEREPDVSGDGAGREDYVSGCEDGARGGRSREPGAGSGEAGDRNDSLRAGGGGWGELCGTASGGFAGGAGEDCAVWPAGRLGCGGRWRMASGRWRP